MPDTFQKMMEHYSQIHTEERAGWVGKSAEAGICIKRIEEGLRHTLRHYEERRVQGRYKFLILWWS